jgi:hypothetical protein
MLLRHLSAEDFTNLLEGAVVPESRRFHLQSCARCMDRFADIQQMRRQIEEAAAGSDEFIPEPDWSEFRSDVRNALLSRSIKREASARRWFGFGLKPVMAFGFSAVLVLGIVWTGVEWNRHPVEPEIAVVEGTSTEEANLASLDAVASKDVFEDLLHLDAGEAESLQMILDDITAQGVSQQ